MDSLKTDATAVSQRNSAYSDLRQKTGEDQRWLGERSEIGGGASLGLAVGLGQEMIWEYKGVTLSETPTSWGHEDCSGWSLLRLPVDA